MNYKIKCDYRNAPRNSLYLILSPTEDYATHIIGTIEVNESPTSWEIFGITIIIIGGIGIFVVPIVCIIIFVCIK